MNPDIERSPRVLVAGEGVDDRVILALARLLRSLGMGVFRLPVPPGLPEACACGLMALEMAADRIRTAVGDVAGEYGVELHPIIEIDHACSTLTIRLEPTPAGVVVVGRPTEPAS